MCWGAGGRVFVRERRSACECICMGGVQRCVHAVRSRPQAGAAGARLPRLPRAACRARRVRPHPHFLHAREAPRQQAAHAQDVRAPVARAHGELNHVCAHHHEVVAGIPAGVPWVNMKRGQSGAAPALARERVRRPGSKGTRFAAPTERRRSHLVDACELRQPFTAKRRRGLLHRHLVGAVDDDLRPGCGVVWKEGGFVLLDMFSLNMHHSAPALPLQAHIGRHLLEFGYEVVKLRLGEPPLARLLVCGGYG